MKLRTLKRELFFLVLLICVVPLLFSSTFINNLVFEKLQKEYHIRSNEFMKQIQFQIKEGLITPSYKAVALLANSDDTLKLARSIGDRVVLRKTELDPGSYQYLARFCEAYSNIAGVGIGTDSGGYFNYPDTVLDESYDPRTRLWYKQGIDSPESAVLTDPYKRTDGEVVIAIAHKFSGDGVQGVVVAGWSLKVLENTIRDFKLKERSSVIVLNQKNIIVVSPDHPEWLLKTPQELNIQGLEDWQDNNGSIRRINLDGKDKVLFMNVSEDTGWKVVSFIDAAELMNEGQQITRNINFIFFATLTIIMLGLYYVTKRIAHPIEGLVTSTQNAISGNYDRRVSLNRGDELGILANSINQIVDELREKCDKIQSQTEQMQRREIEYKTLVENAQDIIIRSDNSHSCLYINPVIKAYSGVDANDLIGNNKWKLKLSRKVRLLIKIIWQQVLETNEESWDTFEAENHQGEKLYFEIHAVPERSHDGSVETVLSIIRNITEQKQMERQIARLDRLNIVGEMAANIGHEVRNPLTVVRGFLQMMQKNELDATKVNTYLSLMLEEIDRASGIISEFLSMAKNKAVYLSMHNLNSTIQAIEPLLQADAIARKCKIVLELEQIPDILMDQKEIRQLLLNLVRNGLEAMPQGGVITIKTYCDDFHVLLTIQDTGCGIPPQVIDRLGIPFTTTKPDGVGLGLSICLSIAARHKAKIDFDTSTEGTSIYVAFLRENQKAKKQRKKE
jgi:PAS domain S-box-containing protein